MSPRFDLQSAPPKPQDSIPFDCPFEDILPENLRKRPDCNYAVALWNLWSSILGDLPLLGPVLVISRNQDVVFGQRFNGYPELEFSSDESFACSESFGFRLPFWKDCFASIVEHNETEFASIEFFDFCQHGIHKICCQNPPRSPNFLDYVAKHQATGLESFLFDRPQQIHPLPAIGEIENRHLLPGSVLQPLLKSVVQDAIPIVADLHSEAVTHTLEFIPECARQNSSWICISDDNHSVHLDSKAVSYLEIETGGEIALHVYNTLGAATCSFVCEERYAPAPWSLVIQGAFPDS